MELRESIIERAICEILYPGTITYHEKHASLCKNFVDKLPHWSVSVPTIELRDEPKSEDAQKIFNVGSKRAFLMYKNPGVYDNYIALAAYVMYRSINELEIQTLQRLGIRVFYFIETDVSFSDLKDLLIEKLFNRENTNRIGGVKDLSWVTVISDRGYDLRINIGPLSPEEIKEGYFLKKEQINPTLLIDIDSFRKDLSIKTQKNMRDALSFSQEKGNEILDNVSSILRG